MVPSSTRSAKLDIQAEFTYAMESKIGAEELKYMKSNWDEQDKRMELLRLQS